MTFPEYLGTDLGCMLVSHWPVPHSLYRREEVAYMYAT